MIITLLALVGAASLILSLFTIALLAAVSIREALRDRKARRDEHERRRRAYDRLRRDIMHAGPPAGTWFPEAKHPFDSERYNLAIGAPVFDEPEKPFSIDDIRKMN
jgi:hypothetical protein